ncbi:hypothetical protein Hypma_004156 [Hypsizygus marmoreus]|uniref:Peptidase A2 domain-containing protein n=1 Tax=Hypsizygus marmoreus TaxID=39966 RepID=A0A369J0C0_HYPMA|nr:hypothetical protein Hypma_004156 [Hypsizygus marmoreus]
MDKGPSREPSPPRTPLRSTSPSKAYALTEMGDLKRRYHSDEEDVGSLAGRALRYASKFKLEIQDIVDRGNNLKTFLPRFAMEESRLIMLTGTIEDLQNTIDSQLYILKRKSGFKVDPMQTFTVVLKGTSSLEEMNAAWIGLRKRIALAQKYIEKYDSEFREIDVLNSPASTNPDLYDFMKDMDRPGDRLNYLLGVIPHMQAEFTQKQVQSFQLAQSSHTYGLEAPSPLKRAFPERHWELDPESFTYGQEGSRVVFNRNVEGLEGKAVEAEAEILGDEEFQREWIGSAEPKGKEKSQTEDVEYEETKGHRDPSPDKEKTGQSYNKKAKLDDFRGPKSGKFSPLLGTGISFKTSDEFFGKRDKDGRKEEPPHFTDPSVLWGAAAPSGFSAKKEQREDDWRPKPKKQREPPRPPSKPPNEKAEKRSRETAASSSNWRTGREKEPPERPRKDDPRRDNENRKPTSRKSERQPKEEDTDRNWKPKTPRGSGPPSGDSDPSDSEGGGGGGGKGNGPWKPPRPPGKKDKQAPDSDDDGDNRKSRAPYGTTIPTIKTEIKVDDLPSWDGSYDTVLQYFWDVQELAQMGGYIPEALGYWLWSKLKIGSDVRQWFSMLDATTKSQAKSHYLSYLQIIKDDYLGQNWQLNVNLEFTSQSFRQNGYERESPRGFIHRRTMYTRMLANADYGGPEEVHTIMLRAPLAWHSVLQVPTIRTTRELWAAVINNEKVLLHASRGASSNVITSDNLLPMLKKMGVNLDIKKPPPWIQNRTVHSTEFEEASTDVTSQSAINNEVGGEMLKQVYQTFKKRQRDPPAGGYPFSKNDHVGTKMGRLPPSPCKVCGSKNHWDKECPDWDTFLATQKKSARWTVSENTDQQDLEDQYSSAYGTLRESRIQEHLTISSQAGLADEKQEQSKSGFKTAVPDSPDLVGSQMRGDMGRKSGEIAEGRPQALNLESELASPITTRSSSTTRRVEIEEIEDEDDIRDKLREVAKTHLIEGHEDEDNDYIELVNSSYQSKTHQKETDWDDEGRLSWKTRQVDQANEEDTVEDTKENVNAFNTETRYTLPNRSEDDDFSWITPSPDAPVLRIPKKRNTLSGQSAVGVSVLSMKGWVGSILNKPTDLRIDSGADITLISEDYYKTLISPPPLQTGLKMKLWQLTDKNASLKGYVRIPIIIEDEEGQLIETEAEAYVVPGMTVPILLGEDYQLTYELGTSRHVNVGTLVHYGSTPHRIRATPVGKTADFKRLRQSAYLNAHFVKTKLHKRNKKRKQLKRKRDSQEAKLVRASQDYKLRPHECKTIEVMGNLGEDREWVIEKNLMANDGQSFFAVPNVLISAAKPWVPVSNTSNHPRWIRKGDIIGSLEDPKEFFDKPKDLPALQKLHEMTAVISNMVTATMASTNDDPSNSTQDMDKSQPAGTASPPQEHVDDETAVEKEQMN